MSSILRKAMWPAALIVGMFVLIGAWGTATAPTAHAAANDVCAILGPFPGPVGVEQTADADDPDTTIDLFEEDETFGFIVVIEDGDDTIDEIDVSVDDEDGDVDLTSFVTAAGAAYTEISGVDIINNVPVLTVAELAGAGAADFFATFDIDVADLDGSHCGVVDTDDQYALFDATCDDTGHVEITATEDTDALPNNAVTNEYDCFGDADSIEISANFTSIESHPAAGNRAHSLITVVLEDSDGNPAFPGEQVDWTVDNGCLIRGIASTEWPFGDDMTGETEDLFDGPFDSHSHAGLDDDSSSDSFLTDPGAVGGPLQTIAQAVIHCESADPGVATVEAEVERPGDDLTASIEITIVGPPAFITVTAAPTDLVCGEKATILVTVTDAINQNVSDHTLVELITNFGGVVGGTGLTVGFSNPVAPLSSGAAETFGGVATAYLLTSTTHVGAYEVVAASGGTPLGGAFSTQVITGQATVTCTEGAAPDVTAPDTGTGSISPPNTGDAGLAASSAGTASLFVIAAAVAFVLAGFASFGFARR